MGFGRGRGRGRGGLDTEDFQSLDSSVCKMCLGAICCALLITAIVLISVSVAVLEPNEAGLRYNTVDFSIENDRVYAGGRYFLGVGQRFIVYSKTVQAVKFNGGDAIKARTSDGLPLSLEVSFNYRIRTESASNLESLFVDYGEMPEVQTVYSRIARNKVREVASQYSTFQYFRNRSRIEGDMQLTLGTTLDEVHAVVESFELLDFQLPSEFDDARDRFLAAQQDVERAQNERVVAEVSAGSRVDRAREEAIRFQTRANGYSQSRTIEAQSVTADIQRRLNAFASGINEIKDALNTTAEQTLSFAWSEALLRAKDRKVPLVVSVPTPDEFSPVPATKDDNQRN